MNELTSDVASLARFESLGNNCEFGFVLRSLGLDEGGLFKWARLEISNLIAAFAGNLENLFVYENLEPLRLAMVQECHYGIGWHSSLFCHQVNGRLEFVDPEPVRRLKHKAELRKFNYLIAKLLARLRAGGLILVYKANEGVARPDVLRLKQELDRLALGARYWLLVVRATDDAALIGTAVAGSDNLIDGHVDRFADYNVADDFSPGPWRGVLNDTLRIAAWDDWEASRRKAAAQLSAQFMHLPFPCGADRRGEWETIDGLRLRIESDNHWSRRLGEVFRLHAGNRASRPARIEWKGVRVNAERKPSVTIGLQWSVAESFPVTVQMIATREDVIEAVETCTVMQEGQVLELRLPEAGTYDLALTAVHAGRLPEGRVAAIDIEAPEIRPMDE